VPILPLRYDLALADMGVDALDLDVEELLHRLLDLRRVAVLATLNITWFCSGRALPSR
jgi:hypothetical protein